MRTLARWTLRGLTFLALLLFIATVAVWVRSYYVNDWFGRVHYAPGIDSEDHHVWVQADSGYLHLDGGGDPAEFFPCVRWAWRHERPWDSGLYGTSGSPLMRRIGISWQNEKREITGEYVWGVSVRLRLVAMVFGLATLLLLRPWRWFLRRAEEGMCPRCGYDLRASTDRCPECGLSITAAAGVTPITRPSASPAPPGGGIP